MTHNFDAAIDRQHSDSEKWNHFDADVLPLWVADMDFRSPEPVVEAIRERVEHGVFGYGRDPQTLREVIVERMKKRYGWQIAPDDLVFIPGVARGFHIVCRAFAAPGDAELVQPPVYPPILTAHSHAGLVSQEAELTRSVDGSYSIDLDAFEHAITSQTRIFLLCNPHNPVGRAFRRDELAALADICLRHNVLICSDEIHCDIVFSGYHHIPIASLAPEIAQQTVTLIAPSKTFNIPGLKCAVAIIQNAELRKCFTDLEYPLAGNPNILGLAAALAAYRDCQPWLDDLLAYLEANRDFVYDYVRTSLPTITMAKPEATFLAWLDCRQAGIPGPRPCEYFIDNARVATNDGATFGRGGEGFVRLNFGCPRSTLVEALERMRRQLAAL